MVQSKIVRIMIVIVWFGCSVLHDVMMFTHVCYVLTERSPAVEFSVFVQEALYVCICIIYT